MVAAIGRRLMQRHDVGKRHLPQIIESDQSLAQNICQVVNLGIVHRRKARVRLLRGDENLVCITRKVWQKSDRGLVLTDNPTSVLLLRGDDVLKDRPPVFAQVSSGNQRFVLDRFEDEVGRVDLTMRVRIRDADHFPLVFEEEDVIDLGTIAQIDILLLPASEQVFDF